MKDNNIILPENSQLLATFESVAKNKRFAFFCGLPGVGKSLMVQQMIAVASALGREVHLVQWDVARLAFEQPHILERFPEIDGATHAAIRLVAGEWVRKSIFKWHNEHQDPNHLLIGECALFGNRFSELASPIDDELEPLLAGSQCHFLVPAPTMKVRQSIEKARKDDLENPQNERDTASAAPNVLESAVQEVYSVGRTLGISIPPKAEYDPELYLLVYQALLKHRQHDALLIDQVLPVTGSAHVSNDLKSELVPSAEEVNVLFNKVKDMNDSVLNEKASSWWEF